VALVEGLAAAVQPLLARDGDEDKNAARLRAAHADTAIFYSISNCQDGLRGVSFGNFLIKQVVEELMAELPHLTRFATLSPVPGFDRWLNRRLATSGAEAAAASAALFREDEGKHLITAGGTVTSAIDAFRALADDGEWWRDTARVRILQRPLLRLCTEYLTRPNKGLGAIDPVARFHLGNGARLERINWLGNTSPRGIKESYGIMVNYLYDPDTIEANHEAFAHDGTVARSPEVDALMAPERRAAHRRSGPARAGSAEAETIRTERQADRSGRKRNKATT
jgi:malonyl-CoA decarboxylase